MKEQHIIEKINRNSGMIEMIVKTAVATLIAVSSAVATVTLFWADMRDIPLKVKELEARVAAIELNSTASLAKIESILSRLEGDFLIIKTQIVRQGLENQLRQEYGGRDVQKP